MDKRLKRAEDQIDWVDEMYEVVRDLQGRVVALEKRLRRVIEENGLDEVDDD